MKEIIDVFLAGSLFGLVMVLVFMLFKFWQHSNMQKDGNITIRYSGMPQGFRRIFTQEFGSN